MTERGWRKCTDPQKMLSHVEQWFAAGLKGGIGGNLFSFHRVFERRFRLCVCALARLIWASLRTECQQVIEVVEAHDGAVYHDKQLELRHIAAEVATADHTELQRLQEAVALSLELERTELEGQLSRMQWRHFGATLTYAAVAEPGWMLRYLRLNCQPIRTELADILRDVFFPFGRSILDSSCRSDTVVSVAQAIYDERAFDRLPILADALEDVGCTHVDLLNHCRQPGEHVRGCWAVDLVLGKE